MNYQDKVLEFQRASGQLVRLKRELTKDELDFRDSLLREEIRELREAIVYDNRVEILDALCDIKYVNDGMANMIGVEQNDEVMESTFTIVLDNIENVLDSLSNNEVFEVDIINMNIYELAFYLGFTLENFKTALDRVHESNMSKFCNDIKTAERTQEFYQRQGINTTMKPREKKFVVYRQGDGKVLKSVEYYPVYLNDLV